MTFNQERYHRYEPRYEERHHNPQESKQTQTQTPQSSQPPHRHRSPRQRTPPRQRSPRQLSPSRQPSPQRSLLYHQDGQYDEVVREQSHSKGIPYQPSHPDRTQQQEDSKEPFTEKKHDFRYDDRFYKDQGTSQEQAYDETSGTRNRYDPDVTPRAGRATKYGANMKELIMSPFEDSAKSHEPIQSDDRPRAGRANSYSTKITDLLTSPSPPEDKKILKANKGYLVLIRFRPQDISEFITAIQDTVSTIHSHTGYVIGFAGPKDMRILISNPETIAKEQWWDTRDRDQSRFAVCAMWFRDIYACKRWFESAPRIKQPDFPNSSPYQVMAVPLTFGQNQEPLQFDIQKEQITLMWVEYPHIYERYENDFLINYSEPARKCMKYYGGTPHISCCRYKPGWPAEANKFGQPGYARMNVQNERCARAIRTGWMDPDTFITVSTFPYMDALTAFNNDEYYRRIQTILGRYTHPTAVAITLQKVRGTSRA